VVVFAVFAAVAWPAVGTGQELVAEGTDAPNDDVESFIRGNGMYETGDYEGAVAAYRDAVSSGVVAPALYYNLGNAHYRTGDLGRAVLNYERALRLAPRDEDARANLALVRSMLRDRHFVGEPGYAGRATSWLYGRLNLRESLLISSLIYFVLVVIVIGFIFRETAFISGLYPKLSLVSPGRFLGLDKSQDFVLAMATLLVLLSASAFVSFGKYRSATSRRAAIVVEEEVHVYGSPTEESTLQFKIHEGTRVTTGQTRPGWIQIRLPGDLSGWISYRSVEKI